MIDIDSLLNEIWVFTLIKALTHFNFNFILLVNFSSCLHPSDADASGLVDWSLYSINFTVNPVHSGTR